MHVIIANTGASKPIRRVILLIIFLITLITQLFIVQASADHSVYRRKKVEFTHFKFTLIISKIVRIVNTSALRLPSSPSVYQKNASLG